MDRRPDDANSQPTMPDSAGGGASSSSSNKRRRIGLACSACRARKSRCDGHRPKCTACDSFGFECVYAQSSSSPNMIVGKEYLIGIENRLKTVEEEIISLKAGRPSKHLRFEDDVEQSHAEDMDTSSNKPTERLEVNSDDVQDTTVAEDATDGMGAVVFSEEEDFGFFGPSSNIAFTRHISQAVTQMSGSSHIGVEPSMVRSQVTGGVMSVSRPASPAGREGCTEKVNIYALPEDSHARELLHHYFSTTGLLFPYLHKQTFWETYEDMRQTRFTKIRRTWLGLLNIVLALSTSTRVGSDTDARTRVQESDIYYQRALGLCEKHIFRASSLEAVQFLLVAGQYLQGTHKSVQAWSIHGLTVKAALQLGLHSSVASRPFSLLEQEIRKRTWYGCVVLDRTLSMTFGRPATIPDNYVKLELPRVLEGDDNLTANSVYFFNATITLYKIMWTIINLSYDGNVGCLASTSVLDAVSDILKMEQQLVEWERSVPTTLYLRKPQDIPAENFDANEKFRIILTLRYHNLRILLHRSMLVRFLEVIGAKDFENPEVAMLLQIGANSIHVCVNSSMDIIAIVSTIVRSGPSHRGMLGAWWFTLYYTFNSALVLCASFLIYHNSSLGVSPATIPLGCLRASIDEAAQALQELDRENRTVITCAKYLRRLATFLDYITSATNLISGVNSTSQCLTNPDQQVSSPSNLLETGNGAGHIMTGFSPFGLGMDLGGFILEGDLEFLNQMTMPVNDGFPTII